MALATVTLEGEQVRLRPLVDDDVPSLQRWLSDPEVAHWLHLSEDPLESRTVAAHRERFERLRDDPAAASWCIETREGRPIGYISLLGIHAQAGRAELGITIGEKDCHGRGLGRDAIRTLLRFAFGELGLARVYLIADHDNARGIRCYERVGFVHEGVLRAHRRRYGRPLDMVIMGVLREEFSGR
jgi:RimJ/RimL family protein N-acetyltransferase